MSRIPLPAASLIAGVCLTAGALIPLLAEDAGGAAVWPAWRGPDSTGVAPAGNPPVRWSETENVRWKAELPGLGTSTPVIWGNRVFVTSAVDEGVPADGAAPAAEGEGAAGGRRLAGAPGMMHRFVVMAIELDTGKVVWERTARRAPPHEGHHPDGTYASGSPVTDGEHVFATFGSQGLYAYDLDGNLKWEKDLGDMRTRLGFGEGASPALHGDTLVLNWDHEDEDFIVALDKRTGEERWRRDRDEITSWTTPLVVEHDGRAQVVVSATGAIRSYDLATGEDLWHTPGMTVNAIPSPVHAGGVVYLTSGFRGSALLAIDLAKARGNLEGTDAIRWRFDRDTPYVPSPLLYDGLLYFLKVNSPILTVIDVANGEVVYGPQRLDGVDNIYASPVGADGRVYIQGRGGEGVVLRAGRKYEVIANNQLEDNFDASPVVAGDRLLLRGRRHLYSLGS
ncbi:MAG TPA: PQQ-binding-like beta-propeller repeat protein [Thermoanaerobaculia bacterium]|nr:PQQ-binding-like beta-propeller repeat protein [Thermoanaerobaculia bacterium]